MSTPPTDYATFCGDDLRDLCRGRGLRCSGPVADLIARLQADDKARAGRATISPAQAPAANPDHTRLAHAERLLDIARAALDEAISRAAARGDRAEVEALHRDRRLLGGG